MKAKQSSNGVQVAELYRKYRPKTLDEVVGQPEAVSVLREWLAKKCVPHAILFSGGSGTGKTTLSRILKTELRCSDPDFYEINAADDRGLDTVRDIRARLNLAPLGGPCRIYLLDEFHQFSKKRGGDAQTALLKMLEDTPKHVYFFLCTTDPEDILPTIHTRCSHVHMKMLGEKEICDLVAYVIHEELDPKNYPPDEVISKIASLAEGSARKALVLLHQVIGLKDADAQLEALESGEEKHAAIEVARALMNPRTTWQDMGRIVAGVKGEEPESIRRMVLAYANKVLLSKGNGRAALILNAFRDNWFSCPDTGLTLACWEVIAEGKK